MALFISMVSMAQSFSQSDLIGNWALDEDCYSPLYFEVEITDSLLTMKFFYENTLRWTQCCHYYLSDSKLTNGDNFNYTLVNQVKYGKYIIYKESVDLSETFDENGNKVSNPPGERPLHYINILGLSSHHLSFTFSDKNPFSFHR